MKQTMMEKEACQAPKIVENQLRQNRSLIATIANKFQQKKPLFIQMIARGSSHHAACFGKYLFETVLGVVTTHSSASIQTIYKANLSLKNSLTISVSQSGQSPDICEFVTKAKKLGSTTLTFVNDTKSPLANLSDFVIPLLAGKETSVAATKSYIASLSALIQLIATIKEDATLLSSLDLLFEKLSQSLEMNWASAIPSFAAVDDLLVIARGYGLPIAKEAALKFKETSSIHAEAFSSAEVQHGPFALIKKNYHTLLFGQKDASLKGVLELCKKIKSLQAKPYLIIDQTLVKDLTIATKILPLPKSFHPICDPLMAIQAFYPFAAKVALQKKKNPDQPDHLQKVTKTI